MAASWAPTVENTTDIIYGWEAAADDPLVTNLINVAVNEVTAEAGDFDPTAVINPSAAEGDQVTLGDLASDAASIRAAHLWASSIAPEMVAATPDLTRELYARFVDAVARLKNRTGTDGDAFTIRTYYEPGFTLAEDWI